MISVLVPIFNFEVLKLIQELNSQCQSANIPYEIVCYDDCSNEFYRKANRSLDAEFGVSYVELSENMGRAKIRNWLAKNARYDNLIFLDCDSEIKNPNFISNYIEHINTASIIYGGRNYDPNKPEDEKKILHWTYGRKRESLKLKSRIKIPYRSFQTNNFMVDRALILSHPFDESIKDYGYEDSLFATTLKNEGIPIKHIENPLIHKGVEENEDFLNKSKLAAENLAILYRDDSLTDTKMVAFHEKLKKIGFNSLLHNLIRRKKGWILKNLYSSKPNLILFDLYRYDVFISKLNALDTSSS
ncbi:glycosyltransferase family 2 protein [Portibacter lacus]|uniref:Glycosyl transferase n=1 Tax=Portibacter lacus TaxID=1099794 RepID=A0AA37WE34_9BACT|nr:glycosyltransferase [Portibacter lacus]GLR15735.1 glycosyl transferase [Portibacter lacus]